MDVRTYPANPLDQVNILNVSAFLRQALYAPMDIADPQRTAKDILSRDFDIDGYRFFK
jgi:hypothetical protein